MNITQKILLLLIIVTFRSSLCQDDLLDRYVQHVDRVMTNTNYLDNRSKIRNQREKRSVNTSFSVVNEDFASDDVSRKMSEDNASEKKVIDGNIGGKKVKVRKYLNSVPARKTKLDDLWTGESRRRKGETRSHKESAHKRRKVGENRRPRSIKTPKLSRSQKSIKQQRLVRRQRSVDFGISSIPNNRLEETFMRRPTKKVLSDNFKKIKSNFTPDLKPYLDRFSSEVSSNDLVDNEEKFRRKRDIGSDLNQWTHAEILDSEGDVILRWQPRHQEISFRVEAKTKGYIGIGFSPNGRMEGADMVIGWVDDAIGKAYLNVSCIFYFSPY